MCHDYNREFWEQSISNTYMEPSLVKAYECICIYKIKLRIDHHHGRWLIDFVFRTIFIVVNTINII